MGRSDRVEELEAQIQQLEATVTGLTDELLECKQRLDELEDVVDSETAESDVMEGSLTSDSSDSNGSFADSSSLLEEVDTYTAAEDESGSETETEGEGDGIIVA